MNKTLLSIVQSNPQVRLAQPRPIHILLRLTKPTLGSIPTYELNQVDTCV